MAIPLLELAGFHTIRHRGHFNGPPFRLHSSAPAANKTHLTLRSHFLTNHFTPITWQTNTSEVVM